MQPNRSPWRPNDDAVAAVIRAWIERQPKPTLRTRILTAMLKARGLWPDELQEAA
jgi:hypothetical protein